MLCSLSVTSYSAEAANSAGEDLIKAVRYASPDGKGYQTGPDYVYGIVWGVDYRDEKESQGEKRYRYQEP